jgi:ABC-type methionine transport system permease subunit
MIYSCRSLGAVVVMYLQRMPESFFMLVTAFQTASKISLQKSQAIAGRTFCGGLGEWLVGSF